ncbi:hypothetical protein VKT23_018339 [Stygiomarasmius scandens]|uniref:Uncharacterized protein n=1 Tax=Marasmiellus scandens TaxID=2682957 RepID=A0ABR1IRK1_9AGAR
MSSSPGVHDVALAFQAADLTLLVYIQQILLGAWSAAVVKARADLTNTASLICSTLPSFLQRHLQLNNYLGLPFGMYFFVDDTPTGIEQKKFIDYDIMHIYSRKVSGPSPD